MLSPLNVVMSVYGQPEMLGLNLDTIASYEDDVLDLLTIIVVDDAGEPPVDEAFCKRFPGVNLHVFRILDDIPWNQPGGRNLGMHRADPQWTVMLDPDMVFSQTQMRKLMTAAGKMRRREVLRYGLRHMNEPERAVDMSSPNTYLIHREDFLAVGGYDEDYSGHKGWSDVQLLDVLRSHFKIVQRPDVFADFYSTGQIKDAAVHSLDRKTKHNRKIRLRKFDEAKRAGGWAKWVRRHKGPNQRLPWIEVFPNP